jgi:hypothetical protein
MIRNNYVQAALISVRRLRDELPQLNAEEIEACLKHECETQRRISILAELLARLVDLNRQNYLNHLKEKYQCLANLL